jgi:hypothetical protein
MYEGLLISGDIGVSFLLRAKIVYQGVAEVN